MEWISVKDKLPGFMAGHSSSDWVMVDWKTNSSVSVEHAYLYHRTWIREDGVEISVDDENAPTHWMKLPDLPKEK